jgi:hypothetical protein
MDAVLAGRERAGTAASPGVDLDCRCSVARRRKELRSAFRLVYDRYCESGLLETNRLRLRILPHQLLDTSWVLLATRGTDAVGTLSLIEDGELGLPVESLYPAGLLRSCRRRARFAELACFAACGLRDHGMRVLRTLLDLAIRLACRREITELAICVHPRHANFYRRRLGFREFGPPRRCPWVHGQPAVAMILSLRAGNQTSIPLLMPQRESASAAIVSGLNRLPAADRAYFQRLLDETSPIAWPNRLAFAA